MTLIIESITDHLEHLQTIGRWHWDEWGHADPEGTAEKWIDGLATRTKRDEIPTTYVALSKQGALLGSVTLVDCDMDTHDNLWPWLAGLYVHPSVRNQGIGGALTRHATVKVQKMEIGELYLYTSTAERLYSRLGWHTVDREFYEGEDVAIMSISLA